MSEPTVFVVEDDEPVRKSIRLMLELAGFRVEAFADGRSFLDRVSPSASGCVVLDHRLPGMSGADVVRALGAGGISMPVLLLSGALSDCAEDLLGEPNVVELVLKPVSPRDLADKVRAALKRAPTGGNA